MIFLVIILVILLYYLIYRDMRAKSTQKTVPRNRSQGAKRKRRNRRKRQLPFSRVNVEPVASGGRANGTKSKKPGNQGGQDQPTTRCFRASAYEILSGDEDSDDSDEYEMEEGE